MIINWVIVDWTLASEAIKEDCSEPVTTTIEKDILAPMEIPDKAKDFFFCVSFFYQIDGSSSLK